nr:DsbA family protein [Nevskia sp.]
MPPATKVVDWYFDVISPYAYLALLKLDDTLPAGVEVRLRPLLFAGLLNHHGHKGPAEIPGKRTW